MLTWIPAPPEGSLPAIVNTAGKDMSPAHEINEHAHFYPSGPPTGKWRDNDKIECSPMTIRYLQACRGKFSRPLIPRHP